jgi:hypothetical protein
MFHHTFVIQVEVFCFVKLCCVAVGYRRFGGPLCLHLHPILRLSYEVLYVTLICVWSLSGGFRLLYY